MKNDGEKGSLVEEGGRAGVSKLSRRGLIRTAAALAAGGLAATEVAAAGIGRGRGGNGKAPELPVAVTGAPVYFPRDDHADEIDLGWKVAVITGASRGIGKAVGQALQAAGVTVIGTSRQPAAHPAHPFDLLELDVADPVSVATFAATVQAHPAVLANGGIDILVNNAGRFSLGSVLPIDPAQFFSGLELAQATLYAGHVGVTSSLLPSLLARAAIGGYARILFTASVVAYGVGGSEPGTSFYHSYFGGKRALLSYANSLRGLLGEVPGAENLRVTTLNPYAVDTELAAGLNPIYLQPVDGLGNAIDPVFQEFLDQARFVLANGLPVERAAEAFRQVLTAAEPLPNVAVGSDAEPFATLGGVDFTNAVGLAEMKESAFPWIAVPPGHA